jgi:cysteine synthase B
MPNQYENDANFLAHYETTGPEIWKQMKGQLTHFFTGCGTGGTITGTATYLKEKNHSIKIIAIQAQKKHLLQGLRNFEESSMPELFVRRQNVVDQWMTASNTESFRMVKELASREGLLVGPSTGAVMASMLKVARKLDTGKMIGIFADDGRKFKSLYTEQKIFNSEEFDRHLKVMKNLPETFANFS